MSDDKKEHPYIDELARDARGVCYNAFAELIERADVIEEELLYANAQREDASKELEAAKSREQSLRLALEKIDKDLESRNFLENSSLRDTVRAALAIYS